MLQWTEITQSQARLPIAMILKVDVYFEWHTAEPSLTIIQQKCSKNNMGTLYYLCSNLLPATSSKHVYILTFGWVFLGFPNLEL